MHGWTGLFGHSALSLRLPSAVAVGVAAACVYSLGARLRGPNFALWAVVVFAATPRVFWTGTEAGRTRSPPCWPRRRHWRCWSRWTPARSSPGGVRRAAGARRAQQPLPRPPHRRAPDQHPLGPPGDRAQRVSGRSRPGWPPCSAPPFLLVAYGQSGQLSDRTFQRSPAGAERDRQPVVPGRHAHHDDGIGRTLISAGDIGSWWQPAALLLAATCWALGGYALVRNRSTLSGSDRRPPAGAGVAAAVDRAAPPR